MKKCKCGEDCAASNAPKQWSFKIPYTQIEIHIWDWSKTDYLDLCVECLMEQERYPYQEIAESAYRDGYNEGLLSSEIDNT